jgi:hypothetical protein
MAACSTKDSTSVPAFLLPILTDGSTTSPNISRGTAYPPGLTAPHPVTSAGTPAKGGDYSYPKITSQRTYAGPVT